MAIVVARPCHNKLDASTLSRLIFASSRSLPSLRRAFSGLHSPSLEPSCLSSRQPHSYTPSTKPCLTWHAPPKPQSQNFPSTLKIPSSRIKLPLLQPTPMRLLGRRTPTRHFHVRRLHVLLRQARADLLVRLSVGFLAVARAVAHALARDAGFERRIVGVRRRLGLGAFCAGGGWRSFRRCCAWACCLGGVGVKAWMRVVG